MGAERTAWHIPFASLIAERAPPGFQVLAEVSLSREPQRADLLILRREDRPAELDKARVVRRLWGWLPKITVAEFKSIARPFRNGDLRRLLGYTVQYHVAKASSLDVSEVAMVLLVPSLTPSLDAELEQMGWLRDYVGKGYHLIEGAVYSVYLVVIDQVAQAERDELLGSFGHRSIETLEVYWWWEEHTMTSKCNTSFQHLPGSEQIFEKLLNRIPLEKRLAGLKPEERLAGLKPEERLAGLKPEERLIGLKPEERLIGLKPEERLIGLKPEERLLGLPDEALRALSAEYIATLSPETQKAIQKRLKRPRVVRRRTRLNVESRH